MRLPLPASSLEPEGCLFGLRKGIRRQGIKQEGLRWDAACLGTRFSKLESQKLSYSQGVADTSINLAGPILLQPCDYIVQYKAYAGWMFEACIPFGPLVASKVTF